MIKKCLHCNLLDGEVEFSYKNSKFCLNGECQEAKKVHAKEMNIKRNISRGKEIKNKKIVYKSDRKCLRCGLDPAPNYFYCGKSKNNCHEIVSM